MKKLFAISIAVLMCVAMPLYAAADAIFYDPSEVNESLIESTIHENDCKAINVFLSNIAEANVTSYGYDSAANSGLAVEGTLKHFELNGDLYTDVSSLTDSNGQKYMVIGAEIFEKKLKQIYNTSVKASDCPGYRDGKIYVTADNYGAPINVFASVTYITYIENGNYRANFILYKTTAELSNRYGTPNCYLPDDKIQSIGKGVCTFKFNGSLTQKTFSVSDFSVLTFDLSEYDETEFLYTNKNAPYPDSVTSSPSVESDTPSGNTSSPSSNISSEKKDVMDDDDRNESPYYIMLVIIGVGIVVLALIILVVILTFFRKKK